jgi:hypothetical protein
MAVTTAASIQTLTSHPPPTTLQVAPASNLVHDASSLISAVDEATPQHSSMTSPDPDFASPRCRFATLPISDGGDVTGDAMGDSCGGATAATAAAGCCAAARPRASC